MQTVRGTTEGALEAWLWGLHIRALQTAYKQFVCPGFLGAWEKTTFLFYALHMSKMLLVNISFYDN